MSKLYPLIWLCKEGKKEFLCEGSREKVEMSCTMWNAVVIRKVTVINEDKQTGKIEYK